MAFIARVLTESQNTSRQQVNELGAEQEKHAQTRRALRRTDAERTEAVQQLRAATQSLDELNQELQDERARHEAPAPA